VKWPDIVLFSEVPKQQDYNKASEVYFHNWDKQILTMYVAFNYFGFWYGSLGFSQTNPTVLTQATGLL